MPLLEIKNLSVRYDKAQILNGVSLAVEEGEFVGLVGPNGAGKSTLLRAVSGLVRFEERMKRGTTGDIVLEGEVLFAGERIDALPSHEIRRRGLVHCPERRRPFRELTVLENLFAGAFLSSSRNETQRRLERSFALFPRLAERKDQIAGTMSAGEPPRRSRALLLSFAPAPPPPGAQTYFYFFKKDRAADVRRDRAAGAAVHAARPRPLGARQGRDAMPPL